MHIYVITVANRKMLADTLHKFRDELIRLAVPPELITINNTQSSLSVGEFKLRLFTINGFEDWQHAGGRAYQLDWKATVYQGVVAAWNVLKALAATEPSEPSTTTAVEQGTEG